MTNLVDRTARVLCEFIDDDAPLHWQRYRPIAQLIAGNPQMMGDLIALSRAQPPAPYCPPGYKLVPIKKDPDWICLEGMTEGELAAYDYGCSSHMAALNGILDGKDSGHGVANEPWESARRRILALMAAQPSAEPLTDEAIRMAMVLTPAYGDDDDYVRLIRMGRAVLTAQELVRMNEIHRQKPDSDLPPI